MRPFALALVLLTGCSAHNFVSSSVEQGPPPFLGPDGEVVAASADGGAPEPPVAPPPPSKEPPVFVRTQDANEWVTKTFKVQSAYARVLVVSPDGKAPEKISAGKLDLNGASGSEAAAELKVDRAFATLAEAAKEAKGGDLVAVLPGRYAGFRLGPRADAGDDKYIHFKALGAPGEVLIDAPAPEDKHWMIILSGAHHVIVQGFHLAGTAKPGDETPPGPNAGILIDGDFLRTSALCHHIAVVGNLSHNHAKWGMHSVDSHTVLVQDNVFAFSGREHGAYISDGSDNYVIRRNVFFGNNASGLQVNVDPLASLEKLARHAAIEHPPLQNNRDWALGLLKQATEKFGLNNFPDGRGFNYIIESNVMTDNGRVGGAALNLAGVRESLIQNNLLYGNHSSGIAQWDNGNPFDAAQVKPGPQGAAEVTGADVLPIFGCFNNVIRNNTILMGVKSRPALGIGNGSWGTKAYNNVVVNDDGPSVELYNTSIWRFDGRANVLDRVSYEGPASWMKTLAISLPDGTHSSTGVKRSSLAQAFVRPTDGPWVVLDGKWWKPAPNRPDYHPRAGAPMLAGRADARQLPRVDLEGKPRQKADIGAYVASP
jgi:hypothetical protein